MQPKTQPEPTLLTYAIDDSPFYMTNHANYVPTNFIAPESHHGFGGVLQSRLDSENEDLRAVIDDLTIENKRLKQMVRRRSRNRRSTPTEEPKQQDKLFEVRMHGLPPEKRRELENLLKNFATSVHLKGSTSGTSSLTTSNSMKSSNSLNNKRTGPQTDSGYASNSNSAPTSGGQISQSDTSLIPNLHKPTSSNKAVRNYLQDIPDALLPRQNPIMSERAKAALVVRQLEQLFTGRKAAPGDHDQPMQQQEISQSAARADLSQDALTGKKRRAEGPREAHIMPPDTKVNLDAFNPADAKEAALPPKLRSMVSSQESSATSRVGSPDQRPTRPLDLDVHRAQIAAENIQYLRHLGMPFSQPSDSSQGNEDNWMFLNLLAGLAQLHTLNVTPEFIRRAVKKLSTKFELSKDGHRVRWIGGADETKFGPEDEKAIEVATLSPHESAEDSGTGGGSSKRSKSNSMSNPAATSNTPSEDKTSGLQTSSGSKPQQNTVSGTSKLRSSNPMKKTATSSAFDYKPIVYRGKPSIDYAGSYLRDSDDSYESPSGDSSGLVHALSKSNLNLRANEGGAVTFYHNSCFFRDLSASHDPSNLNRLRPVVIGETLGIDVPVEGAESPLRFSDATYFTTEFAPEPYRPRDEGEKEKLDIKLPDLGPLARAGEDETLPFDFQVCGLGGVCPADNFVLDVKKEMRPVRSQEEATDAIRVLPFSGRRYHLNYLSEVKSCQEIDLLPSKLPAPTYVFFTSSSSSDAAIADDDDGSDGSSDTSSPQVDEAYPAPPAFLQKFSKSSEEEDEGEFDSSDIDMLAIARGVNTQRITEQERVYMIDEPGLTDRPIAGSLAATVGASRSSSSSPPEPADTSSVGSENGSALQDDEMSNA